MSSLSLLNLPGEIRNEIYRLLLVLPTTQPEATQNHHDKLHPAILAVCHMFYIEGVTFLYRHNIFVAHDALLTSMPRIRRWFPPINSPRCLTSITRFHMHIRLDCDARFTAERATTMLSGLEELIVEVSQAQHGSSSFGNLRRLENVREVKRARVIGSISSFREYAEWLESSLMSRSEEECTPYSETSVEHAKRLKIYGGVGN